MRKEHLIPAKLEGQRQLSRRSFCQVLAVSLAALPTGAAERPAALYPIVGFIKPFQKLEFKRIAETARDLGWDGVEIPVRKGGTIEPVEVEDRLPELAAALKTAGVALSIVATDIDDASDPLTAKVLKTARKLEVPRYRLKHLMYDLKKPIAPQLDLVRSRLRDLAQFNREHQIQGCVQNHSGATYVGAPVWDLWYLLREVDPRDLGIYFDIAHATIEGGLSWPLEAKLVQPQLVTVSVKDFKWIKSGNDRRDWKVDWCPLGEGMVNSTFFKNLRQTEFAGPISMHFEYELGEGKEMLESLRKDTRTLREWL